MASISYFKFLLFPLFICHFFINNPLSGQNGPLEIVGESISGEPGEIVCIDFKVNNFDSIVSMQFGINFSIDQLELEVINTFGNLPSFNGADRNTTCGASNFILEHCRQDQDSSFVRAVWLASTIPDLQSGIELPDGTVLFEICFKIKDTATPGTCKNVTLNSSGFGSSSDSLEFSHANPEKSAISVPAVQTEVCITAPNSILPIGNVLSNCSSNVGASDGELNIIVYGGTPPYVLTNIDNGTTNNITNNEDIITLSNLNSGTYNFIINDASGTSTVLDPIIIGEGNTLNINTIKSTAPSCFNLSNGSIEIQSSGGIPFQGNNYLYEWNTTLLSFSDTSQINRLSNGTYNVTVTDAVGCSITDEFELLTEPLIIDIEPLNNFCNSNGSLQFTITPSGGSGVYNSNVLGVPFQSNFNFSQPTIFSVPEPGKYFISLSDASSGNCEIIDSIEVDYQNTLEIDPQITNVDCQTQSASYEITLSNSDGSVSTSFDYQIVDLSGPNLYEMGSAEPGSSVITLTDVPLSAMGYEMTILSSEGCETVDTLPSAAATGVLTLDNPPVTTSTCSGQSNGSVSIDVTSGSPVTMTFSTGAVFNDNSVILADLDTGSYVVGIANEDGCQITESFVIVANTLTISSASNSNITCTDNVGNITAEVSGGIGPTFSFNWDHANNDNTATLSNVPAGDSYMVTVTDDANGCTSVASLSLNASDAITFDISNASPPECSGSANGSFEVRANGGSANTGTFTYTWSDGTIQSLNSSESAFLFNVGPGVHWVIAEDGECNSETLFLMMPEGLRYQFDLNASTIDPPSCEGQASFVFIEVTPNNLGTSFEFSFPELGIMNSTSQSQNTLGTGDIIIDITDSNGCTTRDTFSIVPANPLVASIDSIASVFPICADEESATVVIDVQGGNGIPTFSWTNSNSTSNTASDLGIGTYSVLVTDDGGCSVEITDINISIPPPITATIGSLDPFCSDDQGGIFVSDVTGGSGLDFSFQVNTDPAVAVSDTAGVFPGDYIVRVFDSEGCSFESESITIAQASILDVVLEANSQVINLGTEVDLSATIISSGVDLAAIDWTPDEDLKFTSANGTDATASPIQDITYEVIVTDVNGCTASDAIDITVSEAVNLFVPNVFRQDLTETSKNRFLKIYAGSSIQIIDNVKIYDRYGSVINEVANIIPNSQGVIVWDGTLKSKDANSGVYICRVAYTLLTGESDVFVSDVTLLR